MLKQNVKQLLTTPDKMDEARIALRRLFLFRSMLSAACKLSVAVSLLAQATLQLLLCGRMTVQLRAIRQDSSNAEVLVALNTSHHQLACGPAEVDSQAFDTV